MKQCSWNIRAEIDVRYLYTYFGQASRGNHEDSRGSISPAETWDPRRVTRGQEPVAESSLTPSHSLSYASAQATGEYGRARCRFSEFTLSPQRRLLVRAGRELPLIHRYFVNLDDALNAGSDQDNAHAPAAHAPPEAVFRRVPCTFAAQTAKFGARASATPPLGNAIGKTIEMPPRFHRPQLSCREEPVPKSVPDTQPAQPLGALLFTSWRRLRRPYRRCVP